MNVQKKAVKAKQKELEVYIAATTELEIQIKDAQGYLDISKGQIANLENLKLSNKSDIKDWNEEFKKLNKREPTAKEKREHSIELYNSFAKTETELQNEKKKAKEVAQELETLNAKLMEYTKKNSSESGKSIAGPSKSAVPGAVIEISSKGEGQLVSKTPKTLGDELTPSPTTVLSSPKPNTRVTPLIESKIDPLDTKLKVTRQSISEEKESIQRLQDFLISSNEEHRQLKSQRSAAKASIKRWVEVFKSTMGRIPTIEDQQSSLERDLFDQFQRLEASMNALKERQEEAQKQIVNSEKSITRMQDILERMEAKVLK